MWRWSGGRDILTELSLCYSIVNHYYGAQRYEQFLQVCWLDRALILLDFALYLISTSVSSVFEVLFMYLKTNFLYILYFTCFLRWVWWDWSLTWLTNHCPSMLKHCCLGHLICKIVSQNDLLCVKCYVKHYSARRFACKCDMCYGHFVRPLLHLSVRPSVCLSHSLSVSKQLNTL